MTDEIKKMEDRQVPKGRIDLVGCGRLGLRIAINLMQVHRGGPKTIAAFDGQKIDGGANDALAKALKLEVSDCFDDETGIGRICRTNQKFIELKRQILDNFSNVRIVNSIDNDKLITNIGIISGFGLKNPEYVLLAKNKNVDILISGDLIQETAILARNLGITLIDLNHHESEIPGLYALGDVLKELKINVGIVDKKPIEVIK